MPNPIIQIGTTGSFELMYSDKGSGADMDVAFYRPLPGDGFSILGDYAQGNHGAPTGIVITMSVQNDDPTNPVLKPPRDFNLIWKDKGSGADKDGSLWMPVPYPNYVPLGAVSQKGHNKPDPIPGLCCVRFDLLKTSTIGTLIWNDKGSGADKHVSVYQIDGGTGLFFTQPNYDPPVGTVWIPKQLAG